MTAFLLDANAMISVLRRGSRSPVAARLREHAGALATSMLVAEELYRGACRIDATLSAKGARIGSFDTLIAAQALARDLTLVTHSIREFHRVAGLRTADWAHPK